MSDNLPLSEQYRLIAKRWVDSDSAANLLEETKSAYLAKKMTELGDMPVSRAEMTVKASEEWTDYITKMVKAREQASLLEVHMAYIQMKFSEWEQRANDIGAVMLGKFERDGLGEDMHKVTGIDYGKGGRLAEALARAQGEIRNPAKGSENPHFKSRFANLADGIMAIREALSKYGIAHTQTTRIDGAVLILTTTLTHAVSGESIESEWPVGAYEKLTPQQMGSSLAYGRRYTLFSLVGIAGADEDDDGNAASRKDEDDGPLIDADQMAQLQELLTETNSKVGVFFLTLGCDGFSDMTVPQYRKGVALLNEKRRRMKEAAP